MAEVLTESFCERCGTRYTFESAQPRVKRLKGVKVLSRGLKNFVLSDDSSLDEAMAAARSDTEREVTAQQLDAFHKTFNFCMTCRQYTCANCWNEVEGACLTCSPHLGHDILPAPFPNLDPLGMTVALDATDAASQNGGNGNGNGHGVPAMDASAWPTADTWPSQDVTDGSGLAVATDADDPGLDEIDVAARMAALTAIGSGHEASQDDIEPVAAEAVAEVADVEPVTDVTTAEPAVESIAADAEVTTAEPIAADASVAEAVADEPADMAAEPIATEPAAPQAARPSTPDEVAAAAAAQTSVLLSRFRPGQSLDAEIEAYEREHDLDHPVAAEAVVVDAATDPHPAETTDFAPSLLEAAIVAHAVAGPETAPEPPAAEIVIVAAEAEPAAEAAPVVEAAPEEAVPEPVAAAEPELVVEAAPEPAVEAAPEPATDVALAAAPEPTTADRDAELAAAAAAAAIAAASRPTDVVAQPTWQIVAPETEPTAAPLTPATPSAPANPASANGQPEWPTNPEWPSQGASAGLPFLGRLAQPTGGLDSLWAESSREVASAAPAPGRPAPIAGVQPCISCGLSLSATARFCRRCGTSQHA